MAARPQDDGYWMTASDGGIFTFGHASFHGSGASQTRAAETVSITASTTGLGYVLLLADGWVLPFVGGVLAAGPSLAERVHGAGMRLGTWITDDPAEAVAAMRAWVDAVATNDPAAIVAARTAAFGS